MTLKQKLQVKFGLIIILALMAGLISYPRITDIIPAPFNKISQLLNKPKINLGLDLQGGIHMEYRADTSKIESGQIPDAMQAVQDVISRRVNAFGVAEPVIYATKSGDDNRLVVELAGVRDIEQAKAMIQETPFLEFKEEGVNDNAKGKGGDLGYVKKGMLVPEFDSVLFDGNLKNGQVYDKVVETQFGWHIIKKIEEKGQGDDREIHAAHILFAKQQSAEGEPQDVIDSINNETRAKAEDILKKALAGEDFAKLANENSDDPGNKPQPDFVSTGLTGKNLKSASVTFQSQGLSEPQVSLKFDDEGTKLFANITKRNLQKQVAIYLDGQIISAPTVQAEITTGEAVITGHFTVDQAKELVRRLNEGALPVPITLIGQQSVEASLGQISLEKSLKAGIIGLLLVVIFMIIYYRFFGLIAVLSLIIYTAIMVTIIKVGISLSAGLILFAFILLAVTVNEGFIFGAIIGYIFLKLIGDLTPMTLTLPGIAGIIISIGMAVDANILIFERTKEEVRRGRNILSAVDEGFKRAWTAIRDGNLSSIFTAVILMLMGVGFVKGFALTLLVGVMISMFTAVMISKTFLNFILGNWIENKLWLIGIKKKKE